MSSRKWKLPRARVVALAVGIGVLGSFATAPASFAANPPQVGQNCQLDGKINGGGSTFQTNAINNAFTYGFQNDVCGPVGTGSNLNTTYLSPQGSAALATGDPSIFSFAGPSTSTSVQGMVAYNSGVVNGTSSLIAGSNGSGAGLKRLSCRTDMFAGTDLPYNGGLTTFAGQLGALNNPTTSGLDGPPGSESGGSAPNYGCQNQGNINTSTVPPPYGPQTPGGYPNTNDAAANAMGMPVAAGAVAYAINLNGMCTNSNGATGGTDIPANLNLTQSEFEKIWQGTINQWNDPTLVGTNPILGSASFASTTVVGSTNPAGSVVVASVTGYYPTGAISIAGFTGVFPYTSVDPSTGTITGATIPANIPAGTAVSEVGDSCAGNIQRVERADNSGTTAITMFTLAGINGGILCPSGTPHWYTNATASSNFDLFPKGCVSPAPPAGTGTTAPNAIFSTALAVNSGSPALITLLDGTNGGIGYAELGLWPTPLPAGVSFANVQNKTLTAFVPPGSAGSKSNCSLPSTPPAGSTGLQAVGLAGFGWSNNTTGGNPPPIGKQDIADTGSGYPACGLTFDLAYQGTGTLAGEIGGPGGTPGCTANATTTTDAGTQGPPPLTGNALNVTTTAGFPSSGTISVQTSSGVQYLNYTNKTSTSFGGIPITVLGSLAAGSTVNGSSTVTLITGACQTASGPVIGMTNDQVMTEYAYFSYVFSPLGQSTAYLPSQTLDPLPSAWTTPLQSGWQSNWAPSGF